MVHPVGTLSVMAAAPILLGRGAVVRHGQRAPAGWEDAERVRVGADELASPAASAERLHDAWLARRPVVVELSCDVVALRAPEHFHGPVYGLGPSFEFTRERLQFLVWANTYDARGAEPVWWHARKAARRIAGAEEGGPADLVGPDGSHWFVDGGPPDPPELPTGTPVVHRFSAESGVLVPVCHRPPACELAPDQLRAVTHPAGGARVIAPAGSGKTRVLTERLRHLIGDRRVDPATVTAVAFNIRAADELRSRLPGLLTRQGPQIRTLNSLGLWVCNELGGGGRHQVLDEMGARDLVQEVFPVKRQANADTVAPYLDALSAVRLGLASPDDVELALPDASGLAEGFNAYRAELRRRRAVDFDEQIYRAIEILVADPDARVRAQSSCRRMLVDEFQDLTPAHLLLIRLLCAPGYDCFGVGDDDQVIYGYAGADPGFLIDFGRFFPGAGSHALEVNYRCPPAAVGAATHLLSYNTRRVRKIIRTPPGRQDPPPAPTGRLAGTGAVALLGVPSEELAHVAVEVIAGWIEEGVGPDQMAVLARVNSALLPVHVACTAAGVAVSSALGPAVLRRTGVRTALAYLHIAQQPEQIRRADLLDTIHRPSRKISRPVVDMLTKRPATSVGDIRRLAGRLSGGDVPKLEGYAHDLEKVAAATTTAEALRTVRVDLGLGAQMDVLDGSRKEAERSTHADDLLAIEAVAALHPEPAGFESWLTELLSRPTASGPTVLLSTVHKIKGKEWSRVVVFGATQGLFPHRLGDDEEGERRVFHVALTRALDRTVVLYDREAPSPFVAELDGSRRHTPLRPGRPPSFASEAKQVTGPPPAGRRTRQPPKSSPRDELVAATIGLELEVGGQRGSVAELREGGVLMRVGSARVAVAYGAPVLVEGRLVCLVSTAAPAIEQALRAWRATTAKAEKVPAYVVLNDVDVRGVAERAPASLAELGRCRGMGPVRLERYGDEILAIVEEASQVEIAHHYPEAGP
jgi:DNA helicase II / ATP-dependent DNA helicase PcrA